MSLSDSQIIFGFISNHVKLSFSFLLYLENTFCNWNYNNFCCEKDLMFAKQVTNLFRKLNAGISCSSPYILFDRIFGKLFLITKLSVFFLSFSSVLLFRECNHLSHTFETLSYFIFLLQKLWDITFSCLFALAVLSNR